MLSSILMMLYIKHPWKRCKRTDSELWQQRTLGSAYAHRDNKKGSKARWSGINACRLYGTWIKWASSVVLESVTPYTQRIIKILSRTPPRIQAIWWNQLGIMCLPQIVCETDRMRGYRHESSTKSNQLTIQDFLVIEEDFILEKSYKEENI